MSESKEKLLLIKLALTVAIIGLLATLVIYSITPNYNSRSMPPRLECINNLRQIDAAKQQWGIEHKKTPGDVPTWDEITPYFGREKKDIPLKCPLGGIYTIGALSNSPTCSLPGHTLD